MQQAGGLLLATALLSLLEAFTSQIDNLILPIFGVTLLNLSFRLAVDSSSSSSSSSGHGVHVGA